FHKFERKEALFALVKRGKLTHLELVKGMPSLVQEYKHIAHRSLQIREEERSSAGRKGKGTVHGRFAGAPVADQYSQRGLRTGALASSHQWRGAARCCPVDLPQYPRDAACPPLTVRGAFPTGG